MYTLVERFHTGPYQDSDKFPLQILTAPELTAMLNKTREKPMWTDTECSKSRSAGPTKGCSGPRHTKWDICIMCEVRYSLSLAVYELYRDSGKLSVTALPAQSPSFTTNKQKEEDIR